jgi:hypothetical protein
MATGVEVSGGAAERREIKFRALKASNGATGSLLNE